MALSLLWLSAVVLSYSLTRAQFYENDGIDYDPFVRPVLNKHICTNVSVEFKLRQLLDLNTKKQTVSLLVWISQSWVDEWLLWPNVSHITKRRLHIHDVWRPDTIIYNSVSAIEQQNFAHRNIPVELHPTMGRNGMNVSRVTWSSPEIFVVTCNLDVEFFPWDEQTCKLVISSWTYDAKELDYISYPVSTQYSFGNQEWRISHASVDDRTECYQAEIFQNEFCWPELHYSFSFKRRPLFFTTTLIAPNAVLVQISLFGFFSLSESTGERHEKITLSVTTVLALSIQLLFVGDIMPLASDPLPRISFFVMQQMEVIFGATACSLILIYAQDYGRKGKRVPRWLQNITFTRFRQNKIKQKSHVLDATIQTLSTNDDRLVTMSIRVESAHSSNSTEQTRVEVIEIRRLLNEFLRLRKAKARVDDSSEHWQTVLKRIELALLAAFSLYAFLASTSFVISKGTTLISLVYFLFG